MLLRSGCHGHDARMIWMISCMHHCVQPIRRYCIVCECKCTSEVGLKEKVPCALSKNNRGPISLYCVIYLRTKFVRGETKYIIPPYPHAVILSTRQASADNRFTNVVKHVKIVEFHDHVWNHHEKYMQKSTNTHGIDSLT